ncbi:N-acetyl-beta-glucosaminyl-glycoprotein 4-beta-N-acetylgalactosaminyltransferase 1 [Exaiptasia diaphana]|nr:N-acetyl-beta-glucosaminyl-glycoprotein 4-beta-N-acetylgalactosaminyltransferase 1 [Exaiptasia diaphana]
MPLNLFDVVRKHTIQGKMAFSPILTRLAFCGRPRTKYVYSEGFYEPYGFGVFSVYKSDWDSFGGMNEKEFKNKWGGEDWEMVDRVINKGYEIEKLRLPGFYHFYHNRKGMWNEQ